jgi:hypothetical protein
MLVRHLATCLVISVLLTLAAVVTATPARADEPLYCLVVMGQTVICV